MGYLLIPIRIEALLLAQDIEVCPPLADFTQLPWYNEVKRENVHAEKPYLGSTISHRPFGSTNLTLKAGLHLHFIMPQYLGGVSDEFKRDGKAYYPALPDRFFIVRRKGSTIEKKWLVESNFVHPANFIPTDGTHSTIIPVMPGYDADHLPLSQQPYRYMGRQTPWGDEAPELKSGDSFENLFDHDLTVLGYGDINFASFYPNSLGSYGFYDAQTTVASSDISYEVFGFYADSNKDLIAKLANKVGKPEELTQLLQDKYDLNLKNALAAMPSDGSLLWGKVVIDKGQAYLKKQDAGGVSEYYAELPEGLEVAMGSTGSEALSVVLANRLAGNKDQSAREKLETLIESILLHPKLSHFSTDLLAKTREARHEKGFKPVNGGNAWTLRGKQGTAKLDGIDFGNLLEKLPPSIVEQYAHLNETQIQYDTAQAEIRTMKDQLHLDWCKYMQTKHRSKDTLSDFDHTEIFTLLITTLDQISRKSENVGSLKVEKKDGQYSILANGELAEKIKAAVEALHGMLNTQSTTSKNSEGNEQTVAWKQLLDIQFVPEAGFWEPNEPVILVEGLDDHSEKLADLSGVCFCADGLSPLRSNDFSSLPQIPDDQKSNFLSQDLSQQHWKPFLLEWQVSLFSTRLKDDPSKDYLPDALAKSDQTANFSLEEFGPDIVKSAQYKEYADFSYEQVFSGSTIMSGHTRELFRKSMEQFLAKAPNEIEEALGNPYYVAKKILEELGKLKALSQALGGFNSACLTRSATMQLPVFDPLEISDTTNVDIQALEKVLSGVARTAPIPKFYFNPFRSGSLKDLHLRFIDNFGLPSAIVNDKTILPALSFRDKAGQLFARPRVIQPTRLNLDWITSENKKCHFLGASTAIHGWLLPNLLDNEIMVYDAGGEALGYLDSNGTWQTPPWNQSDPNLDQNVTDKHLKAVISQMLDRASQFVDLFQAALDNIAPTAQKSDNDMALLLGRPIVVARVGLSFQLKGLRTLGQEWDNLREDLKLENLADWSQRTYSAWTKVKMPYRLGEHGQLNDGLVGYWLEGTDQLSPPLYAPQLSPEELTGDTSSFIQTFGPGGHLFHTRSLEDPQQNFTLLIDPKGLLHATSGILPVKNIALPASAYDDAIKKLKVWFKTGPLIQALQQPDQTNPGQEVHLDLPVLEGYEWSWSDQHPSPKTIMPASSANPLQGHISILEGYLNLTSSNT